MTYITEQWTVVTRSLNWMRNHRNSGFSRAELQAGKAARSWEATPNLITYFTNGETCRYSCGQKKEHGARVLPGYLVLRD